MPENICRFVPSRPAEDALTAVNLVYEKECRTSGRLLLDSAYRMGLVAAGEGVLYTVHSADLLRPGDLFFSFPARPYRVENAGGLRYLYITFLGPRADRIFERLEEGKARHVYPGFGGLLPFWERCVEAARPDNADLLAESVLLHSFSLLVRSSVQTASPETAIRIKRYVDEHGCEDDLTLEKAGRALNYSPKYLSALFRRLLGVPFTAYLEDMRIQRAYSLMEQGIRTVRDVSFLCGYRDPLYFSKVFKRKTGLSPREHLRELRQQEP